MTSFSELKARSSKKNFETLTNELSKLSGSNTNKYKDDRFWKPTLDKAGNGKAIIRFLPPPDGEDSPYIKLYTHGFKGPTGLWYIENSLTTIGQKDYVGEFNIKLYNSSDNKKSPEREQYNRQSRKTHYISNIFVISDPNNPANEGKVFLFKYSKQTLEKIKDKLMPEFDGEEKINVFDLWEGANFKLKVYTADNGIPNYSGSVFDNPSPLSKDDNKLEQVWKQTYSLQAFLEPSNFKSYDELKERFVKVLGLEDEHSSQNSSYKKKVSDPLDNDEIPYTNESSSKSKNYSNDDDFDDIKKLLDNDEDDDDLMNNFKD